jgi:hypothetical protein
VQTTTLPLSIIFHTIARFIDLLPHNYIICRMWTVAQRIGGAGHSLFSLVPACRVKLREILFEVFDANTHLKSRQIVTSDHVIAGRLGFFGRATPKEVVTTTGFLDGAIGIALLHPAPTATANPVNSDRKHLMWHRLASRALHFRLARLG